MCIFDFASLIARRISVLLLESLISDNVGGTTSDNSNAPSNSNTFMTISLSDL